jgi:hypothetical protein
MMRARPARTESHVARLAVATGLLGLAGCGGASDAVPEADVVTVHGVIKVRSQPVAKGLIRFEASGSGNTPQLQSAPIGLGGAYRVKTRVGPNTVTFVLPEAQRDPSLASAKVNFEAKPGDNPFDIELPPR